MKNTEERLKENKFEKGKERRDRQISNNNNRNNL